MNKLLDENWLESLPDTVAENMEKQNAEIIEVICRRIKYFGDLRPTEVKKLTNSMAFSGADFKEIEEIIKKYTGLNSKEIKKIFEQAAYENDCFAKQYYEYRGLSPITHTNNAYLQNICRAISESTLNTFENLSDTYGFKFPGAKAVTLRRAYTQIIDKAIYEIQTGVTDYNTAMRQSVKRLADSGVRVIRESTGEGVVRWESGYSRRVDSSARMNILDGVRRLNQEMLLYHGEKFGSDGVELSAHAISAPDHMYVQGHQFSNEEFNKMQSGQPCTDVNGREYEGFERPIGEWNCKHFAFPIVIGVSEPTYSDEQLENLRENSRKKYDATQEMRKRETEIRRLKDRRMAYSAAGNELDAKRTQREINQKQKEYNKFCADNGLSAKPERTRVEGYKRIPTVDNSVKNDIINTEGDKMGVSVEIDKFTPCLVEKGSGKIVDTQYSLATKADLKISGWNFNWLDKDLKNSEIYKLTLKDDNTIQGLVALNDDPDNYAVHLTLAESAPHNIGKLKKYEGVGGHLFAIAAQKSVEKGYGGFIYFEAKNNDLIRHYRDAFGAKIIGGVHQYRMVIDEECAQELLEKYTLEEEK